VAGIEPADESVLPDGLAADVADVIVDRMSEADPQANIELDLTCAQCGHRWQALFDIESFLWSEINVWARRTLKEIHTLARAYGWSEREILNLSPWRRHFYLNLINNS
jgi:S-adenosylmethionine synthetase